MRHVGQPILHVGHVAHQISARQLRHVQPEHVFDQKPHDVRQRQPPLLLDGGDFRHRLLEVRVEQHARDGLDVLGPRLSGGGVDGVRVDRPVALLRQERRLQDVQRPSHVTRPESRHRVDGVIRDLEVLLTHHELHAVLHGVWPEGREPEPGAPRLERGDHLRDVVADEAEAGVLGVLFDDSTKRELGVFGHGVALVEDDELEPGVRAETHGGRERADLVPHDVDAAICASEDSGRERVSVTGERFRQPLAVGERWLFF